MIHGLFYLLSADWGCLLQYFFTSQGDESIWFSPLLPPILSFPNSPVPHNVVTCLVVRHIWMIATGKINYSLGTSNTNNCHQGGFRSPFQLGHGLLKGLLFCCNQGLILVPPYPLFWSCSLYVRYRTRSHIKTNPCHWTLFLCNRLIKGLLIAIWTLAAVSIMHRFMYNFTLIFKIVENNLINVQPYHNPT